MEATDSVLSSIEWINAGGIFLILTGVALLILEFAVPSFGLFGFAGVSAILIGVVQLHQTGYIEEMPVSASALSFLAGLGVLLSVLGGWYTYRLYKKRVTTGTEAMIGQEVTIINWRDNKGRVMIFGENWQAYSDENLTLSKNDIATISKVENLKIKLIQKPSKENGAS